MCSPNLHQSIGVFKYFVCDSVHIDYLKGQQKTNPFVPCAGKHMLLSDGGVVQITIWQSPWPPRLRCSDILSSDTHSTLNADVEVHHSADQQNVAELHKTALWLPTGGGFPDTILNWVCAGRIRSPKSCTFKCQHTWNVQYTVVCFCGSRRLNIKTNFDVILERMILAWHSLWKVSAVSFIDILLKILHTCIIQTFCSNKQIRLDNYSRNFFYRFLGYGQFRHRDQILW